MKNESAGRTGIVVHDESRLVLKANTALSPSEALWIAGLMVAGIVVAAVLALLLFGPHLDATAVVVVGIGSALVFSYRLTTEVTLLISKDEGRVVLETTNRYLRLRRRRAVHSLSTVTSVELRSRVNPNVLVPGSSPHGAYLHYDVILRTESGRTRLWFTRYPDAAEIICSTIARFASAPFVDLRGHRSA